MYDRVTSNSRGFGFVTFEDEDASGQLLRMRRLEMRGKLVEIKPAEPKASVFPRTQPNAAVKMMHTGSHVLGSPSFPPMPMVSPSHFYHVATAIPYGTTLNEASPDEGILMGPSFLPVGHRFPVDVLPGDQSVSPTLCAAPTAVAVPVAYPTSFPLHSMTMPCSVDGNYYASTAPFDSYFNPDMMHSYIGYTGADATNCVDELPVCYNQYHQHFQASDDYRKYVERNPGKQVHAPE